jgi:hypothetical protein
MEMSQGRDGAAPARRIVAPGRGAILPLCLLGLAAAAAPLAAQDRPLEGRPWIVTVARYGKWPALAGSAALLARAALDRRDAERRREELAAHCGPLPDCRDPLALALAEAADARDARAHRLIVAGELTLVAAGALFVIDLVHDGDGPPNIPFTPFTVLADRRGLLVRASF